MPSYEATIKIRIEGVRNETQATRWAHYARHSITQGSLETPIGTTIVDNVSIISNE